MNFIELWTTFDGRINRKPFWIASLVLAIPIIILSFILAFAFGPSMQLWSSIIISLVAAYPATALMIKRLHDRNRPGIVAAALWAPTVLMYLGQITGITGEMTSFQGQELFVPNGIGMVVYGLAFVVAIYWLVDLGILKGTDGPNDYGPDPLQNG